MSQVLGHERRAAGGRMDSERQARDDVPFSRECATTIVPQLRGSGALPQPMPYPPWRRDLPGLMLGAPRARLRPLLPPFFEAGAARSSSVASSLACLSRRDALAAAPHATHRPPPAAARELGAALGTQGRRRLPLLPYAADPRARAGQSGLEWARVG